MSRCFRYTPHGFVNEGALICGSDESIKLPRSIDVFKEKRKEKQRDSRKEKRRKKTERREEKEREKQKLYGEISGSKGRFDIKPPPKGDSEIEQLERSGITEEHGQPLSSENLSCISDSTQNKKRKKGDNSPVEIQSRGASGLRIKFVLKKPRGAVDAPDTAQVCSTSGTKDTVPSVHGGFQQQSEERVTHNSEIPSSATECSGKGHSMQYVSGDISVKTSYRKLMEDWVPPPMCQEITDEEDLEWLLGTRRQVERGVEKVLVQDEQHLSCRTSCSGPRAMWLREAGIYALPYSVPF